ncbi:MAG TPA: helix-turn-helix domain-containing protein [Solirubrobacteraceae bacterium]|nr:helix-turn-helix domain-containing protein [Solirubrobacteraceae bacterium]
MSLTRDPAIVALREKLEQRVEELSDEATEQIFTDIPAYRNADEHLRRDVRAHVNAHLRASIETLGADREVTREDLLFVRPHAARRGKRVSLSDFVQAFYVGERVLWDTAIELADDDESRRAALAFASRLPRYFEVATTHAAEVYLETQEQLAATGERIRRDLLEDLLAGRDLEPGPRLDAAHAAGLRDGSSFVVISAIPNVSPTDEQLLRGGAAALARAAGPSTPPLAVVRQNEIVLVVPLADGFPATIAPRLDDVQHRLADAGLPLAVAVSTAVSRLASVPEAYREANTIRAAHGSTPGVFALSELSAFEYLTLRPNPTASRLIAPSVHEFVAQDAQDGGPLIATLREYVACDLNARRAAENLHIHVNTAHYRLSRIAERTGLDLHRVSHLIEILISARLADAELVASHNTDRPN